MRIFSKANQLIAQNIPFCLITIINASGSYKSLIGQKGIVEISSAETVMITNTNDLGEMEKIKEISLELAQDCLANQQLMYKTVELDAEEITFFVEPIIPDLELIILGAGHIARPLAKIAQLLDLKITVYDDRPDFANGEFFPGVDRIICDSFEKILAYNIIKPNSIVVVVTRGHKHDLTCLNQLVDKELTYLGMIGSRKRSLEVRQLLLRSGFSESMVERLHAPIGLDIGADTPEEIAISILAEITQERRKSWKKGNLLALDKKTYVGTTDRGAYHTIKQLAEIPRDEAQPMAIATIVKTIGSTPRKAGAKMAVSAIGQTLGTIGGGCGEAEVKVTALEAIRTKKYLLMKVSMNNDVAEDEGMVCGGVMEVFVEPLSME